MCNIRSNPTVTGCRFEQNLSEFEGGGMYDQDSHPTVEDCTFIENFSSVGSGGGMANVRSSPSVTQCDFIRNASMGLCGGMDNLSQSSPLVIDCLFEENTCEFGSVGGMRNNDDSNPTIVGCLFTGNEARRMGGAMLNWQSSPVIIDCEFIRNRAESGGAINNFLSNASVTNCVFERNRAVWGAALLSGGASSGRIVNCSFVANVASSEGGGIRDFDSGIEISNCILWENVPEQIRVSGKMDPVVRFCDIEGGYEGEGNIDQNPQFVDSGGGDFRLRARSPCIDAGDNAAVPEGIERDLDGNVRRMDDPNASDTGRGDCPIVDMGAFEVQSEGGCCLRSPRWQCDGDVDGDGQVNPVDSGLVQASFGSTDETDLCRYDVDCDGQINPVDSGIVQSLFGTCEAPRNVCP